MAVGYWNRSVRSLWISVLLVSLGMMALLIPACGPSTTPTESAAEAQSEPPPTRQEQADESTTSTEPSGTETTAESAAPEEANSSDASEPTPESNPIDCEVSCGDVRTRCADKKVLEKCTAQAGCAVWNKETCKGGEICQEGACVPQKCSGPGECEKGYHCEKDVCVSNDKCCKEGAKQCTLNTAQVCDKGPDGCGVWSKGTTCVAGQSCFKSECKECRHRQCAGPADCCNGTSCTYNYCLVHCTQNSDCASGEYCFEIQAGGQKMCFPDLTEPKGAKCSIIKMCKSGLSCVPLQNDYRCRTDCDPKKGTVGNPKCDTNEACSAVVGAPLGGACLPFQGQGRKLHESCSAQNPCLAPNVCVGETTNATFCLAPCDASPGAKKTCPTTDICAGYDATDSSKGICVQRCSVPNTKDNCKYGQCRSKQNETICL